MASVASIIDRFEGADLAGRALAGGLIVLLAVQVARVGWAAVEPLGPIGEPAPLSHEAKPADFALLQRFDPFHRVSLTGPAAPASAGGFRLFGVRAAGEASSAIIAGADGRQTAYRIGDELAAGVTLAAVEADHVVLASGGTRSTLAFPPAGSNPAPTYAPPPAPQPTPTPEAPPAEGASGASVEDALVARGVTLSESDLDALRSTLLRTPRS